MATSDDSSESILIPKHLSAWTKEILDRGKNRRPSSPRHIPLDLASFGRKYAQAGDQELPPSRIPSPSPTPIAPPRPFNISGYRRRYARASDQELPPTRIPSPVRTPVKAPVVRTVRIAIPSSSASRQPIASSSASRQRVASSSASRQPVASSSASRQPVASSSASRQPIASSSASRPPVASSFASRQPVASPSASKKPIASSSASRRPVISSSASRQQAASSPASRDPVASSAPRQLVAPLPSSLAKPTSVAAYRAHLPPQGSMRIKRATTTAGSLLRGPARRGLRRQSEEEPAAASGARSSRPARPSPPGKETPSPKSPAPAPAHRDVRRQSEEEAAAASRGRSSRPAQLSPPGEATPSPKSPAPAPAHRGVRRQSEEEAAAVSRPRPSRSVPREATPSPKSPAPGPAQPALPPRTATPTPSPAPPAPPPPSLIQPPPKMTVVNTVTAVAGASAAQPNKKKQILLRVNGRAYAKIDAIGRGGSCRVYRVSAESGKMLALKRVPLEGQCERSVQLFLGEIDLLKRFQGCDRVIQLIDHELNRDKKLLSVVMEIGELDFHTFLAGRKGEPMDPVFVRYWWKEMVECVRAVHAKDVIHNDLKPQNFVVAQGRLKVIDFGIANAIETDMTVNVHRDYQVGTPNFMAPEALIDSYAYDLMNSRDADATVRRRMAENVRLGQGKLMRVGKPSDVWSLGCILYQMVYGCPPFAHIRNQNERIRSILDWGYSIEYPARTQHGVRVPTTLIHTMRRCLDRNKKARPTCDDLLAPTDPFLYPRDVLPVPGLLSTGDVIPLCEELVSRLVLSVVQRCRLKMPEEEEVINLWCKGYYEGIKKTLMGVS